MVRFRTKTAGALVALLLVVLSACDSPEDKAARYLADGERYLESGDLKRASVSFRNALRIEPENAGALFGVAAIHEARQHYKEAFEAYRAAAAADPAMIDAHMGYAVLALASGELAAVRAAADQIRAVQPDHPDGLVLEAALAWIIHEASTAAAPLRA